MSEKYLVINSGSSSVKMRVYDISKAENGNMIENEIAKITVEKIGKKDCYWKSNFTGKAKNKTGFPNHLEAIKEILNQLLLHGVINDVKEIKGIGHRVLHGGDIYQNSVIIDDKVLKDIVDLTSLGPLHHPGQIAGIKCMMELLPDVPNIAVFDTSFHQTSPFRWYAMREDLAAKYPKYGFHGTSCRYVTSVMQEKLGKKDVNLLICHIGSGASVTAVKGGKCYETSMGIDPSSGLIMGTRTGDMPWNVFVKILKDHPEWDALELERILNEESGLKGLTGYNDWRDVEQAAKQTEDPKLQKAAIYAINSFIRKLCNYIYKYVGELKEDDSHIDALVFTAGIGENSAFFRKLVVDRLRHSYDIKLDERENNLIGGDNERTEGLITDYSNNYEGLNIWVVPTNEELMIVRDTYNLVNNKSLDLVEPKKLIK